VQQIKTVGLSKSCEAEKRFHIQYNLSQHYFRGSNFKTESDGFLAGNSQSYDIRVISKFSFSRTRKISFEFKLILIHIGLRWAENVMRYLRKRLFRSSFINFPKCPRIFAVTSWNSYLRQSGHTQHWRKPAQRRDHAADPTFTIPVAYLHHHKIVESSANQRPKETAQSVVWRAWPLVRVQSLMRFEQDAQLEVRRRLKVRKKIILAAAAVLKLASGAREQNKVNCPPKNGAENFAALSLTVGKKHSSCQSPTQAN